MESVIPDGEKVYIKSTANLSAGGTALDVTDQVHPLNKIMAERISRIVDLNVIGIDIIADTLEEPIQQAPLVWWKSMRRRGSECI